MNPRLMSFDIVLLGTSCFSRKKSLFLLRRRKNIYISAKWAIHYFEIDHDKSVRWRRCGNMRVGAMVMKKVIVAARD
jgi:hypothetical protein